MFFGGKSQRETKEEEPITTMEKQPSTEVEPVMTGEPRIEKKRERRRFRKKRIRSESEEGEASEEALSEETDRETETKKELTKQREERTALIPPPSTLISETISRYKDTPNFASAFYEKEEAQIQTALEEDEFPMEGAFEPHENREADSQEELLQDSDEVH
jgi:hypothetical protein